MFNQSKHKGDYSMIIFDSLYSVRPDIIVVEIKIRCYIAL